MTEIDVPDFIPGDYVLRCHTDALAPEIRKGDWLIVREQEPKAGQVVVVQTDDGTALRRYEPTGAALAVVTGLMRRFDV